MSMQHHPSEAILTAYAAGNLPEAMSLVVATHLSLCAGCRQHSRSFEAVGGALLAALPPAAMEEDALAHALALIETPVPRAAEPAAPAPLPPDLAAVPAPLASYVHGRRWRRLLPGIALMPLLPEQRQGGAFLIRVAPGLSISQHGHDGRELGLILSGAYRDELGHFAAGDFAETDETISHRPSAVGDTPCTCLIATEGALRFTGVFARTLQAVVGI